MDRRAEARAEVPEVMLAEAAARAIAGARVPEPEPALLLRIMLGKPKQARGAAR